MGMRFSCFLLALMLPLFFSYDLFSKEMVVKESQVNGALVTYISPSNDDLYEKKIVGENDLLSVFLDGSNVSEQYRSFLDAFGLISMGCTATHIGDGLVLTAGHCFRARDFLETNVECSGVTVSWGIREESEPNLISNCVEILGMQRSKDVDFTLFKVDVAPLAQVPVRLRRPKFGDVLSIFSHPSRRPLEWSGECTLETSNNSDYAGKFQFTHQCDTERGSSGAIVLDAKGEAIGVHAGGSLPWNYGTYLKDIPLERILTTSKISFL